MTTALGRLAPPPPGPPIGAGFPDFRFTDARTFGTAYFEQWSLAARSIDLSALERAADMLADAYAIGATVFSCGNGGSAAVADHLQCDHLKGVRTGTDLLPRVVSLASNVDLLTAIANDIGYEDVFAYQLQSQGRRGDVLVAISSSGRSANIVRALSCAREQRMRTIALTGFDGGEARQLAQVPVHVASWNYGIVEDLHQTMMHTIAQFIRQSRMPPDDIVTAQF